MWLAEFQYVYPPPWVRVGIILGPVALLLMGLALRRFYRRGGSN